jgi:hypothetical protein
MSTTYFLSNYEFKVNQRLGNKSYQNAFHTHVRKYFDKNNEILFSSGLTKRLIFERDGVDEYIIYKTLNVNPNELKATIKKTGLIKPNWEILTNTFPYALTLMIRYYQINKMEKELKETLMYLTLAFYSSLHRKYFKYGANEDVMNYTINNLSNKFHIKKDGTLFKSLYLRSETCHNTYTEELVRGEDADIIKYIVSLRDRLNSFVKNISIAYYHNYDNKNYMRTEQDSNEEENYYQTDNLSFQISRVVDKAMDYIITSGIHEKALNYAAKSCDVSRSATRSALASILKKKSSEVRDFITKIIQVYLVSDGNTLDSMMGNKFYFECMKTYSKSNTNDPLVLSIKETLDKWLTETSPNYVKTERIATKSNFRRAIYSYFVFVIRISNSSM